MIKEELYVFNLLEWFSGGVIVFLLFLFYVKLIKEKVVVVTIGLDHK